MAKRRPLLRDHKDGHASVSNLELFFDLVYVFAITQLSHFVHAHFSLTGLVEGLLLFGAVWWVWVYTTWATNWIDPDRVPVRLMVGLAMLAGLVMSAAIPHAFSHHFPDRGWLFAVPLVAVQVGRSAFVAWAMRRDRRSNWFNMGRITIWFALSSALWFAGAAAEVHDRIWWWAAAVAFEYCGPGISYRMPFLGRSRAEEWDIAGDHMAERCGLFIIIALGEGIVVSGATYAEAHPDGVALAALAVAFLGSVLFWWLYFDVGAERGAEHIRHHAQPGRVARFTYTYLHMPIVGGIVLSAVADAALLEDPLAPVSTQLMVAACVGTLAYLVGVGIFKRGTARFGNFPLSHWAGVALLPMTALWAWWARPNALEWSAVNAALLAFIAGWEWRSYNGGWPVVFGRPDATLTPEVSQHSKKH